MQTFTNDGLLKQCGRLWNILNLWFPSYDLRNIRVPGKGLMDSKGGGRGQAEGRPGPAPSLILALTSPAQLVLD